MAISHYMIFNMFYYYSTRSTKKHQINALEMRALRSRCGLTLSIRVQNSAIRECCYIKEDIVMSIEKGMLRWLGHVERMDVKKIDETGA